MARSNKALKSRTLVFDRADADAFGTALRAAFPDIRFLPRDASDWVGDDLDAAPPYLESLGAPEVSMFRVWREPADWRPFWLPLPEGNAIAIANEPRLQFVFYRSDGPFHRDKDGFEWLRDGSLWAYHLKTDREHIRFLGQAWRIAAKMATNILDLDWPKTGERAQTVRTTTWVGRSALRWAAGAPNRILADRYRPLGSVEAPRPPRPLEEIYGPELAAQIREMERIEEERRRKRALRRAARRNG